MIGYDISEPLDVEPAQYFVLVTKREKRACQHCQESAWPRSPLRADRLGGFALSGIPGATIQA
ncbi:MAG: IS66 family transposase zinc-finger binding domain-containing protein [Acidobacteriia bacterium]|nr:IS66 family transposase zinc-finger binding domain-containing protein [Terriglobia bacterium]